MFWVAVIRNSAPGAQMWRNVARWLSWNAKSCLAAVYVGSPLNTPRPLSQSPAGPAGSRLLGIRPEPSVPTPVVRLSKKSAVWSAGVAALPTTMS